MEDRKKDHIALAFQAQTPRNTIDQRFRYEPLLSAHPISGSLKPLSFLGKQMKAPIWVSSMTGGTEKASLINQNLARVCNEFGLGMGLGSCRILLNNDMYLPDFAVRSIIGYDQPFFANLGICQLEQLLESNQYSKISNLVKRLEADGLIIHINPLQEWFQPEGDRNKRAPLESITKLLEMADFPIIVKEVGQGMGPDSLFELLKLPLAAIEFGAYGGTNFAELERLRDSNSQVNNFEPLCYVGADAESMLFNINEIVKNYPDISCRQLIISGGVRTFLDGYYLTQQSSLTSVYGQASTFLKYALQGYDNLAAFVDSQIKGLEVANAYLVVVP